MLGSGILAAVVLAMSPVPATASPSTTTSCPSIGGVDQVLAPGIAILVGEVHGTEQSPAFVSALACNALWAGYSVTVGLEIPIDEGGRVNSFLASAGAQADRDALLAGAFWQSEPHDGRSSVAMVALLDDVRTRRQAGDPIDVALLDDTGDGDRDRAMAGHLAEAANANPEGIVIALTGNAHTMVQPPPDADPGFAPMGQAATELLGSGRVVALDVTFSSGTAWVCTDTCGASTLQGTGPADPAFAITLHLADASSGYHGEYSVGPITASPPAVPA